MVWDRRPHVCLRRTKVRRRETWIISMRVCWIDFWKHAVVVRFFLQILQIWTIFLLILQTFFFTFFQIQVDAIFVRFGASRWFWASKGGTTICSYKFLSIRNGKCPQNRNFYVKNELQTIFFVYNFVFEVQICLFVKNLNRGTKPQLCSRVLLKRCIETRRPSALGNRFRSALNVCCLVGIFLDSM